jgi:hypothetical protein
MARKHRVQADELAVAADRPAGAARRGRRRGASGWLLWRRKWAGRVTPLRRAADELSDLRRRAPPRLDAAVAGKLGPLKLDARGSGAW